MIPSEHYRIGFFDLPRELRDDIYDLCLTHKSYDLPRPRFSNIATVELLLVSHQFAHECLSREAKLATIRIELLWGFGSSVQTHFLPRPARRIQQLKFNIECAEFKDAQCGTVDVLDRYHLRGVHHVLARLSAVRTISIRILMITSRLSPEQIATLFWERGWLMIPKLAKFNVYCFSQGVGRPSQRVLSWSKETGELRVLSGEIDGEDE